MPPLPLHHILPPLPLIPTPTLNPAKHAIAIPHPAAILSSEKVSAGKNVDEMAITDAVFYVADGDLLAAEGPDLDYFAVPLVGVVFLALDE